MTMRWLFPSTFIGVLLLFAAQFYQFDTPAAEPLPTVTLATNGSTKLTTALSAQVNPQVQLSPVPTQTSILESTCRLTAGYGVDVTVHTAPDTTASPIATLYAGRSLNADARTSMDDNQLWYRVWAGGISGWIPGSMVTVSALCSALPVVAAETINAMGTGGVIQPAMPQAAQAPFDRDSYDISIDPNTGSRFEEQVSYPAGDDIDRLWLVFNGTTENRLFTVRMNCEGEAQSSLRWGTPGNPVYSCGMAMPINLNAELMRQNLIVTMQQNGLPGLVNYALEIVPSAARDDNMLFNLRKDTGGIVSGAISYPEGDQSDLYMMQVEDMLGGVYDNRRDFAVTLECVGGNVNAVRWGAQHSPVFACGQTIVLNFSTANNRQLITVTLPEDSPAGYLTYRMTAAPIAPEDFETYAFSVDRNQGGRFGEVVSGPSGDTMDVVIFSASNLTPQDNFRNFEVVMECQGGGVERLRWGINGNTNLFCGSSVRIPVLLSVSNETVLAITLSEGSGYINYTLVAYPLIQSPAQP